MNRYLDETSNVNAAWELTETTFAGRRLVAAAAWNYLCAATMIVHQPYNPFGDPGGDPDRWPHLDDPSARPG